jgi:hypothetical protein
VSVSLSSSNKTQGAPEASMEISVNGKWVRVPALDVLGKITVVKGKWLKMAAVHDEEWLATELEDPATYIRTLKEQPVQGVRADIFTFAQRLPATIAKYEYPMEWDSIAAVRTHSFQEWWAKLPQETRKNVRRSQKRGVVVTVREFDDDLLSGIVGVNNDSPIRQGRRNVHYGKSLDQVRRDQSSFLDRSDFICASYNSEMIGFLKIVYRGDIAAILNLAPKASHSDKRLANALIAKAIELCEEKRISFLTYGKYNYGNKGDSPLREFKSRNGFEEILMPRFYVPLTRWGAFCMRLKMHRGALGLLPRSVIDIGVWARTKWYDVT